jgi:hypothetical protein
MGVLGTSVELFSNHGLNGISFFIFSYKNEDGCRINLRNSKVLINSGGGRSSASNKFVTSS